MVKTTKEESLIMAAVSNANAFNVQIIYVNGINTPKWEAAKQTQTIESALKSRLSNCLVNIFVEYVYNPTTINDYLSNEKSVASVSTTGFGRLVTHMMTKDFVILLTHSNGSKIAAEVLNKTNSLPSPSVSQDQTKSCIYHMQRKVCVINFGADTPMPRNIARVSEVCNYEFEKDGIASFGQMIQSYNSSNPTQIIETIKLPNPKIHKQQFSKQSSRSISNKIVKLAENVQYAIDKAQSHHTFESYAPHIYSVLFNKITEKKSAT